MTNLSEAFLCTQVSWMQWAELCLAHTLRNLYNLFQEPGELVEANGRTVAW